MSAKIKNYFENYVGQSDVVRYCNLVLNALTQGRNIALQPLFFSGFAGLGKTKFANLLAYFLNLLFREKTGEAFHFVEISSSITVPEFLKIWMNEIEGKQVVIFIDECHGLKNLKLVNLLKRIMETERSIKTVRYNDFNLTANPFQQLFILASNDELMDSALCGPSSRTKTLQFQPYSPEEMKEIMRQKAAKQHIDVSEAAIEFFQTRARPNARCISELIENDCKLYGDKITIETAKQIVKDSGRFIGGLRKVDIQTLMFIALDTKGKQVQEIAAACSGEDKKTTSYRLQWLAGMNLIKTLGNGRKGLTPEGLEYLKNLHDSSKRAKREMTVAA